MKVGGMVQQATESPAKHQVPEKLLGTVPQGPVSLRYNMDFQSSL